MIVAHIQGEGLFEELIGQGRVGKGVQAIADNGAITLYILPLEFEQADLGGVLWHLFQTYHPQCRHMVGRNATTGAKLDIAVMRCVEPQAGLGFSYHTGRVESVLTMG